MPEATIPLDDAKNKLTLADPDGPNMSHISVAGGTYTILVAGRDTKVVTVWSTCLSRLVADHRRIVTTLKRCSRS
jgi:hypothetical protein